MKLFRGKIARRFAAATGIAVLSLGGFLGFRLLSGNFHTVIEGELYRSAQPDPASIETWARDHHIKTIINLRGPQENVGWYDAEVATAKKLDIEHVDFALSASRIVTASEVDRLVDIMKNAPRPILIHCKSGADRTGLVSAIYSREVAGKDEETAEKQLSIFFGHIGIRGLSSAYAMDQSWENLEHRDGSKG